MTEGKNEKKERQKCDRKEDRRGECRIVDGRISR